MNIGLFFGSFNPIHQGHLILARAILNLTDLKEIWFVVSPHNPLKERSSLLNQYERLHMVELALQGHSGMRVSSIEFGLSQPSYTIHTLTHLKEKYPNKKFTLIMGADNLKSLPKWKHPELILGNYTVLVYPRVGHYENPYVGHPSIQLVEAPIIELSSTQIRHFIQTGKQIDFMVPDAVREFILKEGYYRNTFSAGS
jgi:nicotinate-nucleotide adenylyltransferase